MQRIDQHSASQTVRWAAQYVIIQALLVAGTAIVVGFCGLPPWHLKHQGTWQNVIARVLTWATLVSGLAELVSGDIACTFDDAKRMAGYLASWIAVCIAQIAVLAVPHAPELAQLIVSAATSIVLAVIHTVLASARKWPDKRAAGCYRVHTAVRWALQAGALLLSCMAAADLPLWRVVIYVVALQALWQMYSWHCAVQCGLMQTCGVYINSLLLTHIASVLATLVAAQLGNVHLAIGVYAVYALGSILYEPRVGLPYFAEDVHMHVWCASLLCMSCHQFNVNVQHGVMQKQDCVVGV